MESERKLRRYFYFGEDMADFGYGSSLLIYAESYRYQMLSFHAIELILTESSFQC